MSKKSKAAQFAEKSYQIHVTGRNVLVTDAMKDYAIEKVQKIERFSDRIIDVQVTMDIQKIDHRVDIVMSVGHILIKSSAATNDMYASIEQAVHKIEKQLRRYKRKIQDHQARGVHVVDMDVNVLRPYRNEEMEEINDEIEGEVASTLYEAWRPHEVVSAEKQPLKTLTIDEAVMKMELSGDHFLIFRQEEDQRVKVMYRRNDGDFGLIAPE